jgi:hypothetical protein
MFIKLRNLSDFINTPAENRLEFRLKAELQTPNAFS